VLVAISGGVDSSAALFLLQKQGYEVLGIYMKMGDEYQESEAAARRTCEYLGVKFYPVNIDAQFKKEIINYFVSSYKQGETPNPCVKCNKLIKFGVLLHWREKLGADFLASGHYIRKEFNKKSGEFELYKASDKNKDQSYFLYNLKQEQLKYLLFPLGELYKKDIKKLVIKQDIPTLKKESTDICFLHKNGQAISQTEYLQDIIKLKAGEIRVVKKEKNKNGKRLTETIGEHKGLPLYTIGQRRGVDIGGTGPYYVAGMSYPHNTLFVVKDSNDSLLMSAKLCSKENSWLSKNAPSGAINCQAVIRYRHKAVDCKVEKDDSGDCLKLADKSKKESDFYRTNFKEKQRAVTVGQSVVWYDGDRLLGGGVVASGDVSDILDYVV
jgi:tRNA-specific 2-thiouridylase